MELHLVNSSPKYHPPTFDPPPPSGYLHLAASVAPPTGPPFVRANTTRQALLARLSGLARDLAAPPDVVRAHGYRAVLIPPAPRGATPAARYDIAVLIETRSPDLADAVRSHPAFGAMLVAADDAATAVHVMSARCARAFGAPGRDGQGLYLFNHFLADPTVSAEDATTLWEHLAGWYVAETGLTNSLLLRPTGHTEHTDKTVSGSDFVFVNHARFDIGLPRLATRQFRKASFHSYVRANLRANHVIAMPVLYRLAWTTETS